ncbi:MAG: DUF4396 domain-containing protein [Rhodospirillaceae bacterium]|nr:MAG: DUF4396 domain-containing protein [Rhodospirillaceae bacterium]
MIPEWLHYLAILALAAGFVVAAWIAWDEWRNPQKMWIMNVVWPVTALFGTGFTLWGYLRYGRLATHAHAQSAGKDAAKKQTPFPVMVAKGASHCGSGCTLGDLIAEWLAFLAPGIAVWFGWRSLFGEKIFAIWILDFIFAFSIGVAFQYFTIKPMRELGVWHGLVQAVKADTLSLTAWQIGMYGFMAIAQFVLFRHLLGTRLEVPTPEFWFMMQLAMIAGFLTSYPVNWWLLKHGIKERM